MKLRRGSFVVLEGLDKTGKSTQRQVLEDAHWESPAPLVTHMPSGLQNCSRDIYRITEENTIGSPLARQLLHLACHAENLPELRAAREQRGLILDRWWWSTMAYGWYGGLRSSIGEKAFQEVIDLVWSGLNADVVFLFLTPLKIDTNNHPEVEEGYRALARKYDDLVVAVPKGSPHEVSMFIQNELRSRSLAVD
jgi:thymidylate kinase